MDKEQTCQSVYPVSNVLEPLHTSDVSWDHESWLRWERKEQKCQSFQNIFRLLRSDMVNFYTCQSGGKAPILFTTQFCKQFNWLLKCIAYLMQKTMLNLNPRADFR